MVLKASFLVLAFTRFTPMFIQVCWYNFLRLKAAQLNRKDLLRRERLPQITASFTNCGGQAVFIKRRRLWEMLLALM
jgi:hypothetical protein